MSEDPIGDAARAARRRRKVPEDAACLFCGEQDPGCLIEVDKSILEEHHIAGVANLPDATVWLCLNHHRRLHAGYLDAGVDLSHPPRRFVLSVIVVVLGACAVLLRKLADTFDWLVHLLRLLIASLDCEYPGWRDLPEAGL
jgi:hypothetical protein